MLDEATSFVLALVYIRTILWWWTVKSSPNKKPAKNRKSRSKSPAKSVSSTNSPARKVERQAGNVLNRTKKLYLSADEVHSRADQLHESVRKLHKTVRGADDPHPDTESSALVIDEKRIVKPKPFPIVGIGASAGGFEAFSELLLNIPRDLVMAIVLVQHLDPKHKSKLSELLRHSAKLPVVEASDDMEVNPNHVYVIPENVTMTISDGRLRLFPRREHANRPMPIDAFFRSLAAHQQNRSIAVVLSGTGTDGSLGLEAIKGEGGITFAQDEGSAKYFGMPGSAIHSGSVDFVLPPLEIAKELARIASHPLVGPPKQKATALGERKSLGEEGEVEKLIHESPSELNTLFSLLRHRRGLDFSLYKQSTLKRRIVRRMILHKLHTLNEYVQLLKKSTSEVDALFKDLLINVTNFFRDEKAFQSLKKKIFPRILKAHNDDTPLRFWTCGCATGEEAYSLAMSLLEFFEQTRTHRPVQIFATDISDSSIEKARAGIYPENILQDVSPERLRRFFTKMNGHYQIHKSVRDMCVFARQNVQIDPPFSNLDLITCRNVLIYFGPVLQRKTIRLFHYALRQPGFLLLGNSETIGTSAEHFGLVDKKHKIYIKKPTFDRVSFEMMQKPKEMHHPVHAPLPSAEKAFDAEKPQDFQGQVDKILLREFSPAAVVLNSDFEVMHFRGRTGSFLEHAPGTASLSLLKMARESLVMPLRLMLNKALKQDVPVKQSGLEVRQNGRHQLVSIEVRPLKLGTSPERFFLVVFDDTEISVEHSFQKGDGHNRQGRYRVQMGRLEQELKATKESLQSIIEEQDATNEEVRSANEEIQSSNEELQSTNEELETAKEELQSTNEELTTLNEELQNRNNELNHVNNDLANLLSSVNVPIMMLGTDLTIRRFTPVAERIFNVIPADIGRPLHDIRRNFLLPDLDSIVVRVIEDLTTVEREVQEPDGHWWMLRVRPYRTRENKIDGAVIVLTDIDELRRGLDVTLGMVKQPLLLLGGDMIVRNVNFAFLNAFGLTRKEIEAQNLFTVARGLFDMPNLRLLLEDVLPKNKQVLDYDIEAELPNVGRRQFKLNATRFLNENHAFQTILLAAEDVTTSR